MHLVVEDIHIGIICCTHSHMTQHETVNVDPDFSYLRRFVFGSCITLRYTSIKKPNSIWDRVLKGPGVFITQPT